MGSTLQEKLIEISTLMKSTKTAWVVEKDAEEGTDLAIYLHFWRDDHVVAACQCPLDRDVALSAAQLAASGFGAEVIAMTFESWHSTLQESPITGERWRPREMQHVAETQPDAIAKGWVAECLTTSVHERGGAFAVGTDPYRIDGNEVVWLEGEGKITLSSDQVGDHGQGYMFETLQEIMSQPTLDDLVIDRADEGDAMAVMVNGLVTDVVARQFHFDMATLSALAERDLVLGVLLGAEAGSERERMIRERLGMSMGINLN